MISISQRFTLVTKIMKKAWSILAMYRLGFYRILLSQIPVQTKQTIYHLKALLTLNAMVQVTPSYLQLQQLKSRKHLESTHQNCCIVLYIKLGRSYEAGNCTIEISVTRAFK